MQFIQIWNDFDEYVGIILRSKTDISIPVYDRLCTYYIYYRRIIYYKNDIYVHLYKIRIQVYGIPKCAEHEVYLKNL